MQYRTFTDSEQEQRDNYVRAHVENDCTDCETIYYPDGEAWRPGEDCPVHGAYCEAWWDDLNRLLDERWPGTWHDEPAATSREP